MRSGLFTAGTTENTASTCTYVRRQQTSETTVLDGRHVIANDLDDEKKGVVHLATYTPLLFSHTTYHCSLIVSDGQTDKPQRAWEIDETSDHTSLP